MKVSYTWLNHHLHSHAEKHGGKTYKLPSPEKIAELLTFNSYEVESFEKVGKDFVFDISILPNRSHDSLSHRGIAREIATLLGKPLYPEKFIDYKISSSKEVFIDIKEPKKCLRYAGVVIENVVVKDSPAWLKERLSAIGQRSINNIVDATNFVMLELGQPLHAFDYDKLILGENKSAQIVVRNAHASEIITTLDGKQVSLGENDLVIADQGKALAIAGIKGGKEAEIDSRTKNIVIESANFDGTQIRKTSKKVGIRTDSSMRFEQGISPDLVEDGIRLAIEMILQIASSSDTKVGNITDAYPRKRKDYKFGVSVSEVNKLLGTKLKESDIEKILKRLGFKFEKVEPLKKILALAPEFAGIPYKYGASISYEAPEVFDCSSYVAYLYAQAGISLPRMAIDQYAYGKLIQEKDLKAGDLIFSNSNTGKIYYESVEFMPGRIKVPEGVDHVGLYLGNGNVAHATSVKGRVLIEPISKEKVVGYRRIITDKEKRFVITSPKERLDLMATRSFLVSGIKEDLIEEIGRVYGYKNIKAVKPKAVKKRAITSQEFIYANKIRESLVNSGYSEVMTYAFRDKGEVEVANPISADKKFLRSLLSSGVGEALTLNLRNAPLLGLSEIKIFEIGKVFTKEREVMRVCVGKVSNKSKVPEIKEYSLEDAYREFYKEEIKSVKKEDKKTLKYKHISQYPFALRDIAVFVPEKVKSSAVLKVIESKCGKLLVQKKLFDVFKKDGRVSYAFNLVFQSDEKTLFDEEIGKIMANVVKALNKNKNWTVR